MITVIHTINELRTHIKNYRDENKNAQIGLIPTMGALHKGHASLITKSAQTCSLSIVSVFVNPTQFGVNEDFSKYPRTLEKDIEVAKEAGANIIFAPSAEEMYGKGYSKDFITLVCPPYDLVNKLCGKTRTGHFDGVATVVSKLFNIVQPDYAFFGQKDAQQLYIIEKMVKDLNFNIKIIPCPIVREDSGLAISSRNQYLSEKEKEYASSLFKSLSAIEKYYKQGIKNTKALFDTAISMLAKEAQLEYLDFIDYDNFEKTDIINGRTLVAICAIVGSTRLIDNIVLE